VLDMIPYSIVVFGSWHILYAALLHSSDPKDTQNQVLCRKIALNYAFAACEAVRTTKHNDRVPYS